MKKSSIFITAGALFMGTLALVSCRRELEQTLPENYEFKNNSQVQVYNAVVNSNRNYLYYDGGPLNGATIAFGTSFPASSYSALGTGLHTFTIKDTLATSTQVPLNFPMSLQANTIYSIFAYDTITSPKQIAVVTTIDQPFDSTARLRFANMVYSKTGIPNIDVFSVKRNAVIFSNIPVTGVTPFIPYATQLNDTLLIRATGTTTTLTPVNGFNPTQKRSYTLVFRGSYNSPSTVPRSAAVFVNR